ncbi:MAG: saccharopine dehydrogenase family protein [Candidatus Binatia bacterium]
MERSYDGSVPDFGLSTALGHTAYEGQRVNIVALGGCGGMGRYAVRTLLDFDFVERLVIADRDVETAVAFAETCGSGAVAAQIDLRDGPGIAKLLDDADVVLNTAGPFFRFAIPVIETAIERGCHYIDICDDWEPTLEMLALDDRARSAGVTALVGMGASPGVSNLLAMVAMESLASVDRVITGWNIEDAAADPRESDLALFRPPRTGDEITASGTREPSASLVHWMHQCSGTIRMFRDGAFVDVPPVEQMELEYPEIGTATVWTVGHPEAVTLPRHRPELRDCLNVMAGPPELIQTLSTLARQVGTGDTSTAEAAARLGAMVADASGSAGAATDQPKLPPLFAVASGTSEDRPRIVAATVLGMPAGGMGGATGVPLAAALKLLADGRLGEHGVFAPEDIIDPLLFFDGLAPLCKPLFEHGAQMLHVTSSD